MAAAEYYLGLMSGTSLDGVDAALVEFGPSGAHLRGHHYLPFDNRLRENLLALHRSQSGEIELAALAANDLARLYSLAVNDLLSGAGVLAEQIVAIGCHGQTIRHCPERGYTIQLGNSALLAELTGITVVSDFRSRDIAAAGQGAPLVPAFHAAIFADPMIHRVIVNIGGIANLTSLPPGGAVSGFDTGPGCMLQDAWARIHLGKAYDANGDWGATGSVILPLLESLLAANYFRAPPPKSTGRDLFDLEYLQSRLIGDERPADVQATLQKFTAETIAGAIREHAPGAGEVYVCGGGARNSRLMQLVAQSLPGLRVDTTDRLGVDADWIEAFAFAWLAQRAIRREPGNLPVVTGAKGPRVLGAIYPA